MARVQFSAALNSIRGSVGGSTFQKNKAGYTFKNKQTSLRSASVSQYTARNFVAELLYLWQSLTDVQRNAWSIYVNYFPTYCKNSKNVLLTGYQLFIKYNLIRLHAGFNPLINISYETPYNYTPFVGFSADVDSLFIEFNDDVEPDFWSALVKLSPPKRPNSPVNSKIYKVVKLSGLSGAIQDITANYVNVFGQLPHAGQYLCHIITIFNVNCPAIQAPFKSIEEITPP
jgi:hypothetical protein